MTPKARTLPAVLESEEAVERTADVGHPKDIMAGEETGSSCSKQRRQCTNAEGRGSQLQDWSGRVPQGPCGTFYPAHGMQYHRFWWARGGGMGGPGGIFQWLTCAYVY